MPVQRTFSKYWGMNTFFRAFALALIVLGLGTGSHAFANGENASGAGEQKTAQVDGPLVPLETVISQIHAQHPGRLVGANGPTVVRGRPIYRIMWDTEGRILTIVVDARTGQIIRKGGE